MYWHVAVQYDVIKDVWAVKDSDTFVTFAPQNLSKYDKKMTEFGFNIPFDRLTGGWSKIVSECYSMAQSIMEHREEKALTRRFEEEQDAKYAYHNLLQITLN
jgi:hypothetical protein